jgi:hypothetical protein
MTAMGSLPFDLFQGPAVPWLVIILLLFMFLEHFRQQRVQREKKNADLQWFSDLHLFGKDLAESPDPKQMADLTMQRTTEMIGSAESYILVQTTGSDAISHVCTQGLSARTVERLSRNFERFAHGRGCGLSCWLDCRSAIGHMVYC